MSEETEHETDNTPPPETVAEKPQEAGHETHPHDVVSALAERVASLETTVQSLLPENRDETPVKRPWTHRKF